MFGTGESPSSSSESITPSTMSSSWVVGTYCCHIGIADFLDRAKDVRRDPHLEIVERGLQALDVDDVGAVPVGELVERVDALVENLLPVTHCVTTPRSIVREGRWTAASANRLV